MSNQVACPGCGAQLRVDDKLLGKSIKCPKCGQVMRTEMPATEVVEEVEEVLPGEDDVEEERPRRRRKSKYVPCPNCGSRRAERVVWTFWGSFYGPALFTHVRCTRCGSTYNGRTGRSNLIPAIIFLTVPLILIVLVLAGIGWVVVSRLTPR